MEEAVLIGELARGSILAGLDEATLVSSPGPRGVRPVLPHLPAIRMPMAMRGRVHVLPRTVGLQQGILRGPHHRRWLPRDDVRLPRLHPAHLRVHQAVVVLYVGMGIVLDEVEALLSAVGIFHRLTELVEADVPRTVDHAPVPQIRAVVYFVKLTHRTLLFLRLKVNNQWFVILPAAFQLTALQLEIIWMNIKYHFMS